MNITAQQLGRICPSSASAAEQYTDALNKTFAQYNISTKARAAAFIAQAAHESGGFTTIKENLNYSATALMVEFKRYFPTLAVAEQYERNPEAIANRVYANRMGNGDEASGDGWLYRGRGLIQLTGHDEYAAFAQSVGQSLTDALAYAETTEGAAMSAGWFWNNAHLNQYADAGNFTEITQKINGGQDGAADRLAYYNRALAVL